MDVQNDYRPECTARELVREAINSARAGDIISVKATVELIREWSPRLHVTDCELVAMIVSASTVLGLFVAFDLREP